MFKIKLDYRQLWKKKYIYKVILKKTSDFVNDNQKLKQKYFLKC